MIAKVTKQPKPKKIKRGRGGKATHSSLKKRHKTSKTQCSSKFNICRKKVLLSVNKIRPMFYFKRCNSLSPSSPGHSGSGEGKGRRMCIYVAGI